MDVAYLSSNPLSHYRNLAVQILSAPHHAMFIVIKAIITVKAKYNWLLSFCDVTIIVDLCNFIAPADMVVVMFPLGSTKDKELVNEDELFVVVDLDVSYNDLILPVIIPLEKTVAVY